MAETLSEELNQQLAETSRVIFGDKARLRVVDPKDVQLLKKNARYMKKSVFDQLTANIEHDGFLSSVPLCQELGDGRLEALSGNHRVKAAIRAGVERIAVIVLPRQSQNRKLSIQLSHNALTGDDDKDLLAELWCGIQGLDEKLYSGLDSELVDDLDSSRFLGFSPARPQCRRLVLWFLPEEVAALDELLDEAAAEAAADETYAAPAEHYERLVDALAKTKQLQNIKNTAVAFMWLLNRLSGGLVFERLDLE
ncbi:MAG: ParB N-terminal domain-containing protein [Planctomycetaceae bacterium]